MNRIVESIFGGLLGGMFGGAMQRQIDRRVAARTRDLALESSRIATALRAANMHLFFQDRDLCYKSVISPQGDGVGRALIGRTDEQVLPSTERDAVIAVKKKVIATGEAGDCDVSYVMPEGRAVFALHIEPVRGPGDDIEGISCTAVDITRVRTLESEQRRLSEELKTTVQRYQLALRESDVTVFTQDRDLRYTSISNPMAGRGVEDIIGRTDGDILVDPGRDAVIALKQQALAVGSPQNGEVRMQLDGVAPQWIDFHIEPLRDVTGAIVGLTGTAFDVTKRKEDDAHLRLLLRELTHRSKNLLAVIQAMARQTARHTNSMQGFVEQFEARLQALATSHDVLVEDGWHGASLAELAALQLRPFVDFLDRQVSIKGPAVQLKPEAAQALGLALHELANNAKRFGALSVPHGQVSVTWSGLPQGDGHIALKWIERGGPAVATPVARRFGSMMIERNLARAVGGKVRLAFPSDGVQCDILIPPEQLVEVGDLRIA
jgi:two-component sensor histidine kinase